MAQVSLRNVKKNFGLGVDVIKGVSLDVREGEFLVFVGPSGCGKTTLLRMIAGLEDITSGDVHIGGTRANNVPPAKRGIAMVFQSYALYPHMNAYNNMAFGLKLSGLPRKEIRSRVEKAAEILQINHLLDRKPKELSGGQRQRVAIGRAIVRKPHVFLFDEPLSNLDAALRVQMRVELSRLHKELNATMIYVTHDQVEAMTLGSRIALINNGRIEQIGTPLDLYQNPVNVFVATFLGSPRMNLIKGEVVSFKSGKATVKVAGGHKVNVSGFAGSAHAGAEVTLGVRPEHFTPAGSAEGIPAHVELTEHLGDHLVAHVRIADAPGLLAVKFAQDSGSIKRGDTLKLAIPPDQCCLFDEKGQAFERQHG